MIAHVGQTHLRVRGCRQPSWRSGISLPSPFQPPEPASTGTGSPDVAGIAKQGQGGRRAQAMGIANRRWDHRVLSVGASRWRASRHERGTACSSCVTRRGAAHHVCTPRHALTGLANPARTRLRSLRQMSVERDDSLPEQGVDAGEVRTACVSAPPIGRRRPSVPRSPARPIAFGSRRARDEARESAHRSRLERSPKPRTTRRRCPRPIDSLPVFGFRLMRTEQPSRRSIHRSAQDGDADPPCGLAPADVGPPWAERLSAMRSSRPRGCVLTIVLRNCTKSAPGAE